MSDPTNWLQVNRNVKRSRIDGPIDTRPAREEAEQQVPYTHQRAHTMTIDSSFLDFHDHGMVNNAFGSVSCRAIQCADLEIENVYPNVSTYLNNHTLKVSVSTDGGSTFTSDTLSVLDIYHESGAIYQQQYPVDGENSMFNVGQPGWSCEAYDSGGGSILTKNLYPPDFDTNTTDYFGIHWERHLAINLVTKLISLDPNVDSVVVTFDKKALSLIIMVYFDSNTLDRIVRIEQPDDPDLVGAPYQLMGWSKSNSLVESEITSTDGELAMYISSPLQPHSGTIPFYSLQSSFAPNKSFDVLKVSQQPQLTSTIATAFMHHRFMGFYHNDRELHTVQFDHPQVLPHQIQVRLVMPDGRPAPGSVRWACKLIFYE